MKSDIQIAQEAKLKPINEIADELNIKEHECHYYGRYKAKISLNVFDRLKDKSQGKLILVSAINPTSAGEGKSTVAIGLAQALKRLKKKTMITLREPSLGPVFGVKGGAAGGGYSQVVPMEDINLHFTGDIHAVGVSHNLLAAAIDNHIHHGNRLDINPMDVSWMRVMDMNERALRNIIVGLGGRTNGPPRESGFQITAASEVMGILCMAKDITDLKDRLGRIIFGFNYQGEPLRTSDLQVNGSMAALLKEALMPNLVQTLENGPAFVHGGPFANIAHGCNSIIATKLATKLADYTVTEAGFGFDLGGEKFLDIKCGYGELTPSAVVLVATCRALKRHGGVPKKEVSNENVEALKKGLPNLDKHIESLGFYNIPFVITINKFANDSDKELEVLISHCRDKGVHFAVCEVWAKGGEGALKLGEEIIKLCEQDPTFTPLYDWKLPLKDKIEIIATKIYGAKGVSYNKASERTLEKATQLGLGELPICIAKTQYTLADIPTLLGRPTDFELSVRDVIIASGAGFIVPITGTIMTMPGLPSVPAYEKIDIDANGKISGLF
jgi:formate--tetrahydrofolate ligase